MKKITLLFVMLLWATSSFAQNDGTSKTGEELLVIIDGIKEIKGSIMIGIYDSDSTYMKKTVCGFKVPVKDYTLEIPLEMDDGTYSIAVFQDLNGNMKLDKGAFGIPSEPYGFSNNAKGIIGPPSFEKSKFDIPNTKVVRINL